MQKFVKLFRDVVFGESFYSTPYKFLISFIDAMKFICVCLFLAVNMCYTLYGMNLAIKMKEKHKSWLRYFLDTPLQTLKS